MPALLEPLDAQEAATMLADAGREGRSVRARGSGSKQAWGAALAAAPDRYISTRRLASPICHYAGDLVATLPAGATLAAANAVLGRERQWLPLDPPHADVATIGGIVATNDSGPRRHHYGSPRDLIVGIELALTDGRVARAGGRVVKNVAGYDLSRLLCGSFGSLALITAATFKLAPLAPFSITIVVEPPDSRRAGELALAVAAAPIAPSAIEIEAPAPRLMVRFETTERSARQQADLASRLLQSAGAAPTVCTGEAERDLWQRHEQHVFGGGGALVKIGVLPTDVAVVLERLQSVTDQLEWSAGGRAALGLLAVRFRGPDQPIADAVVRLRHAVAQRGGTMMVLEAPSPVHAQVDPWGALPHREVMRAVKARFDPHNVLGPGCGPGGI